MAIRTYIKDGKKFFEAYAIDRNKNGEKIQKKKRGITSQRQAEQIEFELKKFVEAKANEEVQLTWESWHEECIRRLKLELKPSTIQSYDGQLKKWIHPHWKTRDLNTISQADVHDLIFDKIDGELVSLHTKRSILKMVRRIFEMAVNDQRLDRNPCKGITVKVPESEQSVLTNAEAQKFLQEAKITNHRFYPIWALALMTGMRSGELYGLKWNRVDLENNAIHVVEQWTSKCGYGPTKTRRCRIVPISDDLAKFLKELKLRSSGEFVLPHLREWTNGEQAQVTRDFCKAIGITEVAFHDLRATFITNLLGRGETLGRVMSMVGHTRLKTTDGYMRKAGVDIKGGTDKLGYSIPAHESGQVLEWRQRL